MTDVWDGRSGGYIYALPLGSIIKLYYEFVCFFAVVVCFSVVVCFCSYCLFLLLSVFAVVCFCCCCLFLLLLFVFAVVVCFVSSQL